MQIEDQMQMRLRYISVLTTCFSVLAAIPAANAQAAPDGKAAYAVCAACHGTKPGEKRLGPSMFGIIGRQAGSQAGFVYSPAMAKSKIKWTKAQVDAFLKAPQKAVPGTRMAFGGVADNTKRAALVDYLATLK